MTIRSRVRQLGVELVGESAYERITAPVRDAPYPAMYAFHKQGRESRRFVRELCDRYAGRRCFIIGNGPSLNELDLSLLQTECTFALNRGYLAFDRMGGASTFLVSVNLNVLRQFGDEIRSLDCCKFLSFRCHRLAPADARNVYLLSRSRSGFYGDRIERGIWEGGTVTYVAMQVAYYLGFRTVYLIGVDHSFTVVGEPHASVVAARADVNHFTPDYFGPGVTWNLPDLAMSEVAYRFARAAYEQDGRQVLNATAGGNLEVFDRVDYEELF